MDRGWAGLGWLAGWLAGWLKFGSLDVWRNFDVGMSGCLEKFGCLDFWRCLLIYILFFFGCLEVHNNMRSPPRSTTMGRRI